MKAEKILVVVVVAVAVALTIYHHFEVFSYFVCDETVS